MACLELRKCDDEFNVKNTDGKALKIMIFTEGTILGPKNIFCHFSHSKYIPIKNSVGLLKLWEEQGAEISYLTSRKKEKHIEEIKELLCKYNFPGKSLYFRSNGEKYKDIVEEHVPDILIEDDCRSIGGAWQMCITYVKPEIKAGIKSIIVKEFKGVDFLPVKLVELLEFKG